MIRKKKCRDCGNAITHNTVCCPYCGAVDPFGYYRKTDRLLCLLTLLSGTTNAAGRSAPPIPDNPSSVTY
ncbi:hypothetical protein, partial [Escherichia coli]|uniref:hypothetical protein n=1 Tax=Escherichia coli TaxID=562 RepID=UPI001BB47223